MAYGGLIELFTMDSFGDEIFSWGASIGKNRLTFLSVASHASGFWI